MELIKHLDNDMMHDIYKCPNCHRPEYYGMMVWRSGHQYCRVCIYQIWSDESREAAEHREDISAARYDRKPNYDYLTYWKPSEKDYIFPIYEDGVNYYEKENIKEESI